MVTIGEILKYKQAVNALPARVARVQLEPDPLRWAETVEIVIRRYPKSPRKLWREASNYVRRNGSIETDVPPRYRAIQALIRHEYSNYDELIDHMKSAQLDPQTERQVYYILKRRMLAAIYERTYWRRGGKLIMNDSWYR